MAISAIHCFLLRDMREHGLLPQGGALLELGEANWYGDVEPMTLVEDIRKFVTDPARRDALAQQLSSLAARSDDTYKFELAKLFYEILFAPTNMQAIDFHGTPTAHRLDLNAPVVLDRRFDVVFNQGTAEHVFDIAQVFRTMHDYTLPGGLMIHESPFTGWIDHGFYNLQPTLFFDLAEVNGYTILGMFIEDQRERAVVQIHNRDAVHELAGSQRIADNAVLFTALRKAKVDRAFEIPIQGYYRRAVSDEARQAWKELR